MLDAINRHSHAFQWGGFCPRVKIAKGTWKLRPACTINIDAIYTPTISRITVAKFTRVGLEFYRENQYGR